MKNILFIGLMKNCEIKHVIAVIFNNYSSLEGIFVLFSIILKIFKTELRKL